MEQTLAQTSKKELVEKTIQHTSKCSAKIFQDLVNQELPSPQYKDFDCGTIGDYRKEDIIKSDEYRDFFNELPNSKLPILYYFEIISDHSAQTVREALTKYKYAQGAKAVPAMKKTFDENSKILYVGKVKKIFWGRIIQHLGYYKVKRTQGLQLFHWAKPLGLKVRLHYYEFPQEMANFMTIVERAVAHELRPISGRH